MPQESLRYFAVLLCPENIQIRIVSEGPTHYKLKWAAQEVEEEDTMWTFEDSCTAKEKVDEKLVEEWKYWQKVKDQFVPIPEAELPGLRRAFVQQLQLGIQNALIKQQHALKASGTFSFTYNAPPGTYAALVCRDWAAEFSQEDFAARPRSSMSLSLADFITTLKEFPEEPLPPAARVWLYQAGYHGRHVHLSDKMPFRISFTHSRVIEQLSHAQCLACLYEGPEMSRPNNCNTIRVPIFPACTITVTVPWCAGVLADIQRLFGQAVL